MRAQRRIRGVAFVRRVLVAWSVCLVTIGAAALPAVAEDVEVHPSWDNMPGVPVIQRVLDVIAQAGLASSVGSLLVGGGMLGLGRITGSMGSGNRAAGYILGGGGGAFVIAVGAKIVTWLIAPSTVHAT